MQEFCVVASGNRMRLPACVRTPRVPASSFLHRDTAIGSSVKLEPVMLLKCSHRKPLMMRENECVEHGIREARSSP
jgi:hypothetical protein